MAREAEEDRARRIEEARRKVEEILAEARRNSEERRQQVLTAARAAEEALTLRAHQGAQAEAGKAMLVMEQSVVEEVLAQVGPELERLARRPEFAQMIGPLLEEALAAAEGPVVVLAPAQHAEVCRRRLAGHGRPETPVYVFEGVCDGVAVEDPQHRYRVTNRLSSRYARVRDEARKLCLRMLFSQDNTGP
jgi:vacuolar-type H+-ATPase subunit E/Vma4